jgi:hypothetical protein
MSIYTRYLNIFKILEHRGIEYATAPLSQDEFDKFLNTTYQKALHIDVPASGSHTPISMFYVKPDSESTPGAIYSYIKTHINSTTQHIIVFVNIDGPTTKIYEKIRSERSGAYVEVIMHYQLAIDWPRSTAYMPHTIMDSNDKDLEQIKTYGLKPMTIDVSDPGVIWTGARIGDYLRIESATSDIQIRKVTL